MKVKVFYHDRCFDGACSAALFSRFYADRIRTRDWMGEETKAKALEKLAAVTPKIGYPTKWRDYSSLEIKTDSYYQNVVRAETFRLRGEFERAIADCNEAIRLQPESFMAYATRGAAFRQKGDFATAMADLGHALRLKPDYQWARDQLDLARRRHR